MFLPQLGVTLVFETTKCQRERCVVLVRKASAGLGCLVIVQRRSARRVVLWHAERKLILNGHVFSNAECHLLTGESEA